VTYFVFELDHCPLNRRFCFLHRMLPELTSSWSGASGRCRVWRRRSNTSGIRSCQNVCQRNNARGIFRRGSICWAIPKNSSEVGHHYITRARMAKNSDSPLVFQFRRENCQWEGSQLSLEDLYEVGIVFRNNLELRRLTFSVPYLYV
jgi:hypothetical protein